jgi:hypothetical protein
MLARLIISQNARDGLVWLNRARATAETGQPMASGIEPLRSPTMAALEITGP